MILTTGVVSMVDGALSSYTTYGYTANNYSASPACSATNLTNCIVAATQSYLDAPYGLAFDNSGNLYIAEEGKQAILVVNTSAKTNTVAGVVIPAGTVAKIVGATTAGLSTCPNGFSGTNGCNFPATGVSYTVGASANVSLIDNPYGVAVDPTGNVYFSDYYLYNVPEVAGSGSSAGDIYLYAGVQNTKGTITFPVTTRANNGSFAIGNPHGVAADGNSNVYITDATNGTIWRVDGSGQVAGTMTQPMYPVAGGVSTVCTTSIVPGVTMIDTYGDGCPGTGAKFGTGTTGGIFGVSVDAYSDLFVGDTLYPLVREVASGTQFGSVGANQPTDYVKIHFSAGDGPASSSPYQMTTGAANFSLGTASCTTNSDTTKDCVLPITATPSTPGAFTGTLAVMATNGGLASFPLSGNFVTTPFTRTVVSAVQQSISCTNTTANNTSTPVTLTATLSSNGIGTPTGTVTFYANGTQIGTAQALANGTSATLTYTFATAGSYAITATYTPTTGSYYSGSTSSALNVTSAVPSLNGSTITYQQSTVSAGQTALYSLNVVQNVYAGTITFSCSGLPANSSCVFNPPSFTATGCQATNTVALSIITQQGSQPIAASLGGAGRGPWTALSILSCLGLVLLIRVRRRQLLRYSQIWMVLAALLAVAGIASCNGTIQTTPAAATPAGSYSIVVTASGSTGTTFSYPAVTLTVH
jgi:hypothetical protein